MGQLNELLAELRAESLKLGISVPNPIPGEAWLAAAVMPLSHRAGRPEQLVPQLSTGSLTLQPTTGDVLRSALGTDGSVFFWVGPSRFLEPAVALFLKVGAEARLKAQGLLAPWDTKGIVGHRVLGRSIAPDEAAKLVARYSLPHIEAREFLGAVISACFAGCGEYVRGARPSANYPGRACIPFGQKAGEGEAAAYTFEARFAGPVPAGPEVDAVVLSPIHLEGVTRAQLTDLRAWCRKEGVTYRETKVDEPMSQAVEEMTRKLLRDRGMP